MNPEHRFKEKVGPIFGPLASITEGKSYTKRRLVQLRAHYLEWRGVSGTHEEGCDAITVSRQDPSLNEEDSTYPYFYCVPICMPS